MNELESLQEFFEAVKRLACDQGLMEDWTFMRRLAALEIELMSLSMTVQRTAQGMQEILQIKVPEVEQRLSDLAVESLGYYALPLESGRAGENEPPIGPACSGMIRAQIHAAARASSQDNVKDRLAQMLFGLK